MDYKEYNEQLQELGNRYWKEGTRAWERYAAAVREASSGNWSAGDAQQRFTRVAQSEGKEFMQKLMQCNIDYYVNLMNTGMEFSNRMFDSILRPATAEPAQAEESVAARATGKTPYTEVHFTAKTGETKSQVFVVSNKQAEEVEVSFEISEFISEDGKTRTRVPVSFKPDRFTLGQGKEQIVECQVTFDKTLAPGQRHHALARVVGFPDMVLRLILSPGDD